MKQILYILSAIGLIVSSCSKDLDSGLGSGNNVAASFVNSTITRATNEEWAPKDEIGIFAYDEEGAVYNSYENIPYITINGGSSASFTPSGTTIYYPAGGSKLSFIAYSPYQESADDGLYDVNLSAQSTTAEVALIDLIVSNDGAQYSNTNTNANLQLNHKLAKLTMTLKAGDGLQTSDLVGAEVKLTNIATEGTYDLKGGTFTPSSSDQTITPRTITADSKFEAIIFPYAAATFDAEFTLPVTGKTYTWSTNETFTSGKDHAYTITIAESKISVSSATLSGWSVNESSDITANKVVWDGTIATAFESGTGTESDPYIIKNGEQLAYLAQQVSLGTTYGGCYFQQANNIDLNKINWTPVGVFPNHFSGSYNGGSYEISGLYVVKKDNTTNVYNEDISLFGRIDATKETKSAVIKNIILKEPEIDSYSYSACLVGYALNIDIDNCHVKGGSLTSSAHFNGAFVGEFITGTIKNCTNSADVSGTMYNGGMVGYCSDVTIDNCTNLADATITSSNLLTGGIAGYAEDSWIKNSINEGKVVNTNNAFGGIVAEMNESTSSTNIRISNCINRGTITGNSGGNEYSCGGGIAGWCNSAIADCTNEGEVISGTNITNKGYNTGGIVGSYSSIVSIKNCINSAPVTGTMQTGGIAGGVFNGGIDKCTNTATVQSITKNQSTSRAGGIAGYSAYGIDNSNNSGDIASKSNSNSGYCYQTGGIVAYYTATTPIDNCHNTGDVNGKLRVGGIAGQIDNGCISNCSNSSNVINGTYSTGGVLGYISNTSVSKLAILNSHNTGNVNVTSDSYYSNSGQIVGGIAGTAVGISIENCYNKGEVQASKYTAAGIAANYDNNSYSITTHIVASYNEGKIISPTMAFGIIGSALGNSTTGSVIGCYNTGDISTSSYGAGFAYYNKGVNMSCCYTIGGIYALSGSSISYSKYDFSYPSNKGYGSISQLYYVDDSSDNVISTYTSTTVKCTMVELNAKVDDMNATIAAKGYNYKFVADPTGVSHPTLTATN